MNIFSKKFISYLFITIFLSAGLSLSFQSLLALTYNPVLDPFGGNIFRKTALVSEGDSDSVIVSNVPIGTLSNFQAGSNGLFVNAPTDQVMIGPIDLMQHSALNVVGSLRLGNYPTSSRPTCNFLLVGSFYFDTTQDRPFICTSTGWKFF